MAARASRAVIVAAHPTLVRPAILSHIFKFVVRTHKDVKVLHVHSAWEDTAVNYSPLMWERLTALARVDSAPPLPEPVASEQWSQHVFNHYVCRVWSRRSLTPSVFGRILSRLAAPSVVDLSWHSLVCDSSLQLLANVKHIVALNLSFCS